MRTAFIEALCEAAESDSRIFLVCGDLGYSVLERFSARFPKRFLNAGVAEQNMIGVAAGLSLTGNVVFVYSIVNFPVMRCLEQVRNDVAYHNLNVKIVTVGGGLVYGGHGYTHHGAEDLAAMHLMPNMLVMAPGDPVETKLAVPLLASHNGPSYLRLGRGGEEVIHSNAETLMTIGKAIRVNSGQDVTIATTGGTLGLAHKAAELLSKQRIKVDLISFHTLAPFDSVALLESLRSTNKLVTVEEHGWGGLGTIAAEIVARSGIAVQFRSIRLCREPLEVAGNHEYLRGLHGISTDAIVAACQEMARS